MRGSLAAVVAAATAIGSWAADPPKDYKDVPPADLGIKPVPEKKDQKTGFIVGGKNSTALIKGLKEIAGRPIPDLEVDMRPMAKSEVGSTEGFLGAEEKLIDVLAADNAYVVDERGLTHQDLGRHLRVLAAIGLKRLVDAQKAKKDPPDEPFTYHGRRYTITFLFTRGYQLSPFQDGTKTDTSAKLTNADTGKKLSYSLLVPDMIERYGFYEGSGTSYRVPPRDIIAVLDFLKPKVKKE